MFCAPLIVPMPLRLFFSSVCASARRLPEQTALNNLGIYEQLRSVAESDYFSKIQMGLNGECPIGTRKCSASACGVRKVDFGGQKGVIDLLQTREAYSKHAATGSAEVWTALHAVAGRDAYVSRLLSGLRLSITTHISAFYMPYIGGYVSSPHVLQRVHNESYQRNLEELYAVYRTAVAALLNSPSEIPEAVLELSAKIVQQNAAELGHRAHGGPVLRAPASLSIMDELNIDNLHISPSVLPLFGEMIGLLSCLNCEKCMLWGTIQIRGLRAAVKALNKKPLTKLDLICLVNAFRRASVSIREGPRLMRARFALLRHLTMYYYYELLGGTVLISIFVLRHLHARRSKSR
ncbi:hypothetical protein PAPHI01_1502 [Pancytospora philotis]|nr:hypothetical protein PAPHI01_1502 [Pancytospora philotis]